MLPHQHFPSPWLQDDPGDYDFYFDTARRRTCYIAPERFIDPSERIPEPQAKLTESMDLFSVGSVPSGPMLLPALMHDSRCTRRPSVWPGSCRLRTDVLVLTMLSRCVIAEMFSDGRQVFDLSHLLEYRRHQLAPPLKWIKNDGVRVGRLGTCLSVSCQMTVM